MKYVILSLLLLSFVNCNMCFAISERQFTDICWAIKPIIRHNNSTQDAFDNLEQKIRCIDSGDVTDFKECLEYAADIRRASSDENKRGVALIKAMNRYVKHSESCCVSKKMSSVELREVYLSNLK